MDPRKRSRPFPSEEPPAKLRRAVAKPAFAAAVRAVLVRGQVSGIAAWEAAPGAPEVSVTDAGHVEFSLHLSGQRVLVKAEAEGKGVRLQNMGHLFPDITQVALSFHAQRLILPELEDPSQGEADLVDSVVVVLHEGLLPRLRTLFTPSKRRRRCGLELLRSKCEPHRPHWLQELRARVHLRPGLIVGGGGGDDDGHDGDSEGGSSDSEADPLDDEPDNGAGGEPMDVDGDGGANDVPTCIDLTLTRSADERTDSDSTDLLIMDDGRGSRTPPKPKPKARKPKARPQVARKPKAQERRKPRPQQAESKESPSEEPSRGRKRKRTSPDVAFQVGDVVWACADQSSVPWPAVVCRDEKKKKKGNRSDQRRLVRFFGPQHEFLYAVPTSRLTAFDANVDKLEEYAEQLTRAPRTRPFDAETLRDAFKRAEAAQEAHSIGLPTAWFLPTIRRYWFKMGEAEQYKAHLKEQGFVVIKRVLTPEEVQEAEQEVWEWLRTTYGMEPRKPDTWGEFPADDATGLIAANTDQDVGQSPALWTVRCHPNVRRVFAAILGDDDLLTSFDGLNAFRPWCEHKAWKTKGAWWHVDQSHRLPDGKGRQAIQGFFLYTDMQVTTGGFAVVPGSHLKHPAVCRKGHVPCKHTHFVNSSERQLWALDLGPGERVLAQAGDLVLWDSRTVHTNIHGAKMLKKKKSGHVASHYHRKDRLLRLIAYVSLSPRRKLRDEQLLKRWAAAIQGETHGHHARVTPYTKLNLDHHDVDSFWAAMTVDRARLIGLPRALLKDNAEPTKEEIETYMTDALQLDE